MGYTQRTPADVAQEVAMLISKTKIKNQHPHTIDRAVRCVHIELVRDTLAWYRFIFCMVSIYILHGIGLYFAWYWFIFQ